MSKKLFALAAAFAMTASLGVSGAQADNGYGKSKGGYGAVNVKQNGNGCRNRCYGGQTFNAGVNNGNNYGSNSGQGYNGGRNANVKQNGNGCRNRCYGGQTHNAGVNNGNNYGKSKQGYGGH